MKNFAQFMKQAQQIQQEINRSTTRQEEYEIIQTIEDNNSEYVYIRNKKTNTGFCF